MDKVVVDGWARRALSAEVLNELKRVHVPTAAGIMFGRGYRNSYMIGPLTTARVGEVFTYLQR